ncbi:hypothetical protein B0H19DRAFT_1134143 [Mycena capillaripes]|nr:hypothetical protein B0H19DRAFT_1134143 [Mycena capillaripes]
MNPLALLFHPHLRVYILRLLLLADVVLIVLLGLSVPQVDNGDPDSPNQGPSVLAGFVCAVTILVHHALVVFKWRMSGLAIVDLLAVLAEISILSYSRANYQDLGLIITSQLITFDVVTFVHIFAIVEIVILVVSAVFRISTIMRTHEGFLRQRLVFLGCCTPSHPPYTPTSIFLNRSLARPLVRGESKLVIVARALVISCLGIIVPAFGLYSILLLPAQSEVYTKLIASSALIEQSELPGLLEGQASLTLAQFNSSALNVTDVTMTKFGSSNPTQCLTTVDSFDKSFLRVQCSVGWLEINSMSISLSVSPGPRGGALLYMAPWYSDVGFINWLDVQAFDPDYRTLEVVPTVLLAGSARFGVITWTARRRRGLRSAWQYEPEIMDLQTDPAVELLSPNSAVLTLYQASTSPRRIVEDVSDASVISGISSLGGFWTFVNGAFALVFGANIIYFAFGRKPLSALGVIHLFQRRGLIRQWHQDFPALHTEGGLPGSESAGIVAFIRERMVDVTDPGATEDGNEGEMTESGGSLTSGLASQVETTLSNDDPQGSLESLPARYLTKQSGFILDEIHV